MSNSSNGEFESFSTVFAYEPLENVTEYPDIINLTSTIKSAVVVLNEPQLRTFLRYILVGWGTLIVGSFGLVGNTLSAIILIRPSMRSSLNLLLFFLTVWDSLLISTTILYLSIPTIFRYLNISQPLENIWFPQSGPYLYALRCTAQLGSAMFTLLVTTERYIAVCWPLHSRTICTKRKAIFSALATSLLVILLNFPRFWDFEAVPVSLENYNSNGTLKYTMESTAWRLNKIYYMYYLTWGAFAVNSALPFLALLVLNYFICKAIAEFNKTRKVIASTNGSQQKEISLTKMFVCVIAVSLITMGLNLFLVVIDTFWVLDLSWQLWYVEKVLATFNSSVNCVFYCAFGTRFRQEFGKMFGGNNLVCMRRRKGSSDPKKNIFVENVDISDNSSATQTTLCSSNHSVEFESPEQTKM